MLLNGFNPKRIPEKHERREGVLCIGPVQSLVEQVVLEKGRQRQSMDFTQTVSS